jgi:hypothetical protein
VAAAAADAAASCRLPVAVRWWCWWQRVPLLLAS